MKTFGIQHSLSLSLVFTISTRFQLWMGERGCIWSTMSVIETGKAADELDIFLRGDPDDPDGTKITRVASSHHLF